MLTPASPTSPQRFEKIMDTPGTEQVGPSELLCIVNFSNITSTLPSLHLILLWKDVGTDEALNLSITFILPCLCTFWHAIFIFNTLFPYFFLIIFSVALC